MEVTTVSPSPASPPEGDDLCQTDVTSVSIHSVTLLICLCGMAGNGAVIGLFNLKIRHADFCMLAVIDFLFLLFAVPSAILLLLVEDMSCSPILTLLYLNFTSQLSVLSCFWALFWLMRTSNVSSMYKLCWLCCRWKLPECLLWGVISVQYWAFFALFAVIPTVTFLCSSHKQELCRAALISVYTIMLLLFIAFRLISSTVDFISAKWGYQQQQPKTCDIIIIIIALFTLLLMLCSFLQQLGYITMSSEVVFLLACIHNSIKPFIYFLAGRCRTPCSMQSLQLTLQRVYEDTKEKTAHSNDPVMDMGV